VLSIWGYRTRTKLKDPIRFPLIGSTFRLALSTAICGYSIWFWFSGIHSVDDRSCPSYTFIFAKADIRGAIRILFEAQSVLVLVVYALLLLQEFLVVIAFTISSICISVIIGIFAAVFRSDEELSLLRSCARMIKEAIRTMIVIVWSWSNGSATSGAWRGFIRLPILLVLNLWIFALRSFIQLCCLLIFKRSPPMGFPPLLPLPNSGKGIKSLDEAAKCVLDISLLSFVNRL
jgi:hypothetical protein